MTGRPTDERCLATVSEALQQDQWSCHLASHHFYSSVANLPWCNTQRSGWCWKTYLVEAVRAHIEHTDTITTTLCHTAHLLSARLVLTSASPIISPNLANILTPTKTVLQNLPSCNTQSPDRVWEHLSHQGSTFLRRGGNSFEHMFLKCTPNSNMVDIFKVNTCPPPGSLISPDKSQIQCNWPWLFCVQVDLFVLRFFIYVRSNDGAWNVWYSCMN
jgi:hypothetical protein